MRMGATVGRQLDCFHDLDFTSMGHARQRWGVWRSTRVARRSRRWCGWNQSARRTGRCVPFPPTPLSPNPNPLPATYRYRRYHGGRAVPRALCAPYSTHARLSSPNQSQARPGWGLRVIAGGVLRCAAGLCVDCTVFVPRGGE